MNGLELTVKQEKFCLEYAKSGNARTAYINAGYKHSKDSTTDVNACRLLKKDKIKARLAELAEEAKNDSIADIREMQEILTQIIRQTAKEEVIGFDVTNGSYKKVSKTPAIKNVIDAINTLGKMQGAFVEKIESEIDMNLNINIDYGE